MTTIFEVEHECAVCGNTSKHPALGSTNRMGYPDLDLRPPEMYRSTMHIWILECPNCGYVAPKLDEETEITIDFLKSDSYLGCDGLEFKSDLAKRFYRSYLIAKKIGNAEGEYYSILYCVWACDDADDDLSVEMRRLAVKSVTRLIEKNPKNKNDLLIAKSDLMRRSRQFDDMIDEFKSVRIGEKIHNDILRFEIEKAKKGDDDRYTTEDVIG